MTRSEYRECPACGSLNTAETDLRFTARTVEQDRSCGNCPVEFTNTFSKLDVEITGPEAFTPDEEVEFTPASDLDE